MLQPLGISAEAEAVYVVLAPLHTGSVDQLAELAAMPTDRVEQWLEQLRDFGLATELSHGLWQALPLPEVVKALRAKRLSELEMATAAAESLHSQLLAASASQSDDIKILVGREATTAAYREILQDARNDLCVFDKPPYVETHPTDAESLRQHSPEWQAMARGVRSRAVYHPGFDEERLQELLLSTQQGEKCRTAPVPMKLIIVDAQVAIIPSMRSYLPGHELLMSVVTHPTLVEALQFLFNAIWESAIPIRAAAVSESDPRRQMLVSLLMAGSTDDAIANNLGINVRSVRRWVAELMDELGVTTRLQLGAALVRVEHARSAMPTAKDRRPSALRIAQR